MNTRQLMINSIHSMNKHYTWEWLNEQTDEILLALSHPLDRNEYAYRLKQESQNIEDNCDGMVDWRETQ